MKKLLNKATTKYIQPSKAKVGDIMMSNGKIMTLASCMSNKDKNLTPVGVVMIPKGILPDGKGRIVSLDYMDYNNPAEGTKAPVLICWGDSVTEFPDNMCTYGFWKTFASDNSLITGVQKGYNGIPSNYAKKSYESNVYPKHYYNEGGGPPQYPMLSSFLSGEKLNSNIFLEETTIPGTSTTTSLRESYEEGFKIAQIDFDGKGNTDRIIAATTAETLTNSSNQGNFPAANCCHAYKKGNREWYLPAIGEAIMIYQNFNLFKMAYVACGGFDYDDPYFWTSSCFQINSSSSATENAFRVYADDGYVGDDYRGNGGRVLACSAF